MTHTTDPVTAEQAHLQTLTKPEDPAHLAIRLSAYINAHYMDLDSGDLDCLHDAHAILRRLAGFGPASKEGT